MYISIPKFSNWLNISSRTFSRSLLLSNTNDTLSMYIMRNISNGTPELKYFVLWMTICPIERGDLLCIENVSFVSPFLAHYFSNVSEISMTIHRKRTEAMLSRCLTHTLKGPNVSKFPIISLTKLCSYILMIAEQKRGGAPYLTRIAIRMF